MQIEPHRRNPASRSFVAATLAMAFMAGTALANVAPTDAAGDVAFGARPGNVIGTGSSLPLSDQASNITEANTHSRIAPRLPSPQTVSETPRDLLAAASRALQAGRTGEAQEALERAESRLLSRSVESARVTEPSADPLVSRVAEARKALAGGNLAQASHLVGATLSLGGTDATG